MSLLVGAALAEEDSVAKANFSDATVEEGFLSWYTEMKAELEASESDNDSLAGEGSVAKAILRGMILEAEMEAAEDVEINDTRRLWTDETMPEPNSRLLVTESEGQCMEQCHLTLFHHRLCAGAGEGFTRQSYHCRLVKGFLTDMQKSIPPLQQELQEYKNSVANKAVQWQECEASKKTSLSACVRGWTNHVEHLKALLFGCSKTYNALLSQHRQQSGGRRVEAINDQRQLLGSATEAAEIGDDRRTEEDSVAKANLRGMILETETEGAEAAEAAGVNDDRRLVTEVWPGPNIRQPTETERECLDTCHLDICPYVPYQYHCKPDMALYQRIRTHLHSIIMQLQRDLGLEKLALANREKNLQDCVLDRKTEVETCHAKMARQFEQLLYTFRACRRSTQLLSQSFVR